MNKKNLGISHLELLRQLLTTLGTHPLLIWDNQDIGRVVEMLERVNRAMFLWKHHVQLQDDELIMVNEHYNKMTKHLIVFKENIDELPDGYHPKHPVTMQAIKDVKEQLLDLVIPIERI